MPSIQKRTTKYGSIRYRALVRVIGHPIRSATFTKKLDAVLWGHKIEAEIKNGNYFGHPQSPKIHHTVVELIDKYIDEISPQKKDPCHIQQLNWWKDQIGKYRLDHVTPALIAEYRKKLSQGKTYKGTNRGPATVNRYLAAISHAFTIARKEWQWVEQNPVIQIRKLRESRGRTRFLSDEERDRLLTACQGSRNANLYPIVMLALSTGMRKGEILGLQWKDVDLIRKRIVLHETKNGEKRVVPLPRLALSLMAAQQNEGKPLENSFVFHKRNKPCQRICMREAWVNALKRAKIEDFTFHDLRHSAASYLAMSGASLLEIAEVLGHKSLEMVKRYSHLSETHISSVLERMNFRVFK